MFEVRADHNRHVVCVFNRGTRITHFLGIDGTQLAPSQMPTEKFERTYSVIPKRRHCGEMVDCTPLDFARNYMRNEATRKMVPISIAAARVLMAIIRGQSDSGDVSTQLLENSMTAKTEPGEFRRPGGPVATVHKFLDSKIEQIRAGTVSRKELLDKLVEKGTSAGTASTQCGVWARNNGITFVRPSQAAETKKEARSKAAKPRAKKAKADEAAAS